MTNSFRLNGRDHVMLTIHARDDEFILEATEKFMPVQRMIFSKEDAHRLITFLKDHS